MVIYQRLEELVAYADQQCLLSQQQRKKLNDLPEEKAENSDKNSFIKDF